MFTDVEEYNKIIKCDECGRSMPQGRLAEHLDYHFAVNIRKEQFIEVKQEIMLSGKGGVGKKRKVKGKSPEVKGKYPKIEDYFKNR